MSSARQPAVAGRFYPATQEECVDMLDQMTRRIPIDATPVGAIVPHAGWVYSGRTAALGIAAVGTAAPETVVLFGAVHVLDPNHASVYPAGTWETPLGSLAVDEELAERVASCRHVAAAAAAHRNEHSIEVQLPLVQHILGDVEILPIMVRPGEFAAEIGRACAREAVGLGRKVVLLGSTDLTHYGRAFGFEPHGRGEEGFRWAKDVNDRRFVDLIRALDAEAIVPEAVANRNACGAGAVAATIAAAVELGADRYVELEHTTSIEQEVGGGVHSLNSVGYEAGVFTRPD